jgi:hypothetical protein
MVLFRNTKLQFGVSVNQISGDQNSFLDFSILKVAIPKKVQEIKAY